VKTFLAVLVIFALCVIVIVLTWLVHDEDTAWVEDCDVDQLEE
jgi:hypothetical protein